MSDNLLPCPFCDGEAALDSVEVMDDHVVSDRYYVFCFECFAESANLATEAEAIAAWNRRAAPATMATPITPTLVEAMEFRLQTGPFGIPDVVHYIRSIAEMEIAVLFGNDGSVEVIACGTYRQYDNDIVAVSLPTITTMERLRMLVAVVSTE
jgi:Lar family restriction alleviation protein